MNQMSVKIDYEDEGHEHVRFVFILDGLATGYWIDPVLLEVSLKVDGVYSDMLECVCGGGDNNYEILSRKEGEVIIWELVRYTLSENIEKKFEGMVWTEEAYKKFPDKPIGPPTFSVSNIEQVVKEMRSFFNEQGKLEEHDAAVKRIVALTAKDGAQEIQEFRKKYEGQHARNRDKA